MSTICQIGVYFPPHQCQLIKPILKMKTLLLLITVASYGQTFKINFGTAKLKQTDNAAAKVNVQAADGSVNTMQKKTIRCIKFCSSKLPTCQRQKIYVTK
jgi:hypothetical protein